MVNQANNDIRKVMLQTIDWNNLETLEVARRRKFQRFGHTTRKTGSLLQYMM